MDVASIFASLDAGFFRLLADRSQQDAAVSGVEIFESGESIAPRSIVLGVGVTGEEAALSLIEAAASHGAAAVVLRPESLEQATQSSDVALVELAQEVRWEQAYLLLRTVLNASRDSASHGGSDASPGDLFAFADAVACAVGGPTLIADAQWNILAYANLDYEVDQARRDAILALTPTESSQQRIAELGLMGQLRASNEVRRWTDQIGDSLVERLTVPISTGDEMLGILTVAQAGTPLKSDAEEALAQAAKLAAVHLVVHRSLESTKRRARAAFLREVLDGRPRSDPPEALMRRPLTVMVFGLGGREQIPDAAARDRVLSQIRLYAESRHPDAHCAWIDERVWAVLPAVASNHHEAMVNLAEKIVDEVHNSTSISLIAAIGATVTSITHLPYSRTTAERTLSVLRRRQDGRRVAHFADVQAQAGLLQVIDWMSHRDDLEVEHLEQLRDHDQARKTSYIETLRAYLDSWGDIPAAAGTLHIHRNTLRHRLDKLIDISGINLDDPDERLMLELQLRSSNDSAELD